MNKIPLSVVALAAVSVSATAAEAVSKEEMTFKCLPESNGTWCILRQIGKIGDGSFFALG